MGQLPRKPSLPLSLDSVWQYVELSNNVLAHKINFGSTMGNTDPDNNMDCWKATGNTSVAANTEFFIKHNLIRIPIFYIYTLDQAGDLYTFYGGMTAWTKATNAGNDGKIFLKCTAANANYQIIIF